MYITLIFQTGDRPDVPGQTTWNMDVFLQVVKEMVSSMQVMLLFSYTKVIPASLLPSPFYTIILMIIKFLRAFLKNTTFYTKAILKIKSRNIIELKDSNIIMVVPFLIFNSTQDIPYVCPGKFLQLSPLTCHRTVNLIQR